VVADIESNANTVTIDTMTPTAHQATQRDIEHAARLYAVEHIEAYGDRIDVPGRWYDTRPMLDLREHPPESVDLACLALRTARALGVIEHHAEHPHLVLIVWPQGRT
jgi:hypothetical protein